MKRLIILIAILLMVTPIYAMENESKINVLNMPREKLFEIADLEYLSLPLKESLTDKTLQRQIWNYCSRRQLKYTDLLINLYKESNFKAETFVDTKDGYCAIGMGCITIPIEEYEENKHLQDAWENAKRVINIMCDIRKRYQTKDLEEMIICYQYGHWYLEPYRTGEYVPPKKSWYDRIEEAREYLRKQIIRVLLKQVEKGRVIESSVKTYNTHLPQDFKF